MDKVIEEKVRRCFGEDVSLKSLSRLLGGAQKHVYLGILDDGFKFVVYVWDKSTSYFSDYENETDDVFLSSSALMFELNNKLMVEHGIKTPRLYYMDEGFEEPVYALVEYIDGVNLDYVLEKQPERANVVLKSLKRNLDALHEIKSSKVGQLNNFLGEEFDPIEYCYCVAFENVDYLVEVDEENASSYLQLKIILENLMKNIERRCDFRFIHSELGPNHVMIDGEDNVYMIDIEGARFFDLEYEESFLKIRFTDNYKYLKSDNLDENRMKFYHIFHCFGNLSGAYELLAKNYYDKDDVLGMISYFRNAIKELCIQNK